MRILGWIRVLAFAGIFVATGLCDSGGIAMTAAKAGGISNVIIPQSDRFIPVALQVRVGDTVRWINNDTDDHTLVSDSPLNTTGPQPFDVVIPGTDNNGGVPGTYEITFDQPGTFVYYCRFHAHLDIYAQPVAPGPDGGVQDVSGNFGTPMMGVIIVERGKPAK